MIIVSPAQQTVLDVWFWLATDYTMAAVMQQPISECMVRASGSPAVPPHDLQPRINAGPRFHEQPLSRGGLSSRLKCHLVDIKAYEGESLHSFRRGMAQHSAQHGQNRATIMGRMLIKTADILDKVYLPVHRHDSGANRLRSVSGQGGPSMPP